MATYVHNGTAWQELTGTDRPSVNVSGTWQGVNNIYVNVSGTWQQVYQYDVTAPSVRTYTVTGQSNANIRFAWSGGALVTDAASGVASVKIQRQYTPFGGSGEGWTDVRTLTSGEWQSTSGFFDFTPATNKRRQWTIAAPYSTETVSRYYMGLRVVATDVVGNTTTTSEVKAFTKPYGTFDTYPTDQDSVEVGGTWLNLTSHAVRAGDFTGVSGLNYDYGVYCYGTSLYDACLGYTPDSGNVYVQRYSSSGTSGTWYLQAHNLTSATGTPTFTGDLYGASISGTDDYETCAMPANWLSAFAAGTAYGVGLVRFSGSTAARVLRNWFEDGSDSGHSWITFN